MQNTPFKTGPITLTTTLGTNLLNAPTLTGGVGILPAKAYLMLKFMRVVNRTGTAATCSFFLGATGGSAAGTEVGASALSVPANSFVDIPFPPSGLMMTTADFLTGGAGTSSALTVTIMGEIGVMA